MSDHPNEMRPEAIAWLRQAMDLRDGAQPFPWQRELAGDTQVRDRFIRIPTGFGKTKGVLAAWAHNRIARGDSNWPARLVWMLPMRTLVEQTHRECTEFMRRVGLLWDGEGSHEGKVGVHVLMGGADAGEFHLYPEHAAVLIGTQDMVLSRALNRGYGSSRARWPMDFGLLSQDALWVLDEVQLMGVGFATSLQMAAFRSDAPRLRPTHMWAMSATLQQSWLSKSPDTVTMATQIVGSELAVGDRALPRWTTSLKPLTRLEVQSPAQLAARVAASHSELSGPRRLTMVVCNTVERARALFDEVGKRVALDGTRVHLLHSRFRGMERALWQESVLASALPGAASVEDRIIVATQVVEAGVDLSADLMFTEICPWSSLVQRFGRLARQGGTGAAVVVALDLQKQAAPYDADALEAAWDALSDLEDVSSRSLEAFEQRRPELLDGLYPFEPSHLVLREEVEELFDTTPDLEGGDLDISRFIREGDERDVAVAWFDALRDERGRVLPPDPQARPEREALCAVPFLTARDWLCGKATKSSVPRYLRKGVAAFVWDYPRGVWRSCERDDLIPGAQVLVDKRVGGYDVTRGFDPGARGELPVPALRLAGPQERADDADDAEDLSQTQWQTISFHVQEVARELARISEAIAFEGGASNWAPVLSLAARWHDVGKAHPGFQRAITGDGRPERPDLAKAPKSAWGRVGMRHEVASMLALFDVLTRHAAPEHPARLGSLAALAGGVEGPERDPSDPTEVEQEVLALSADAFDLVAYLVCAHHGKVRARLHGSAADQALPLRDGSPPLRGIYEGDRLPALTLPDAAGRASRLPESHLSLDPASLGLSARTGRSWTERVDTLRRRHGVFALAYAEALLRAADVRASRDATLRDPALFVSGGNASGERRA